jgi:coatomer protein complex subunit gamma
VPQVPGKTRRDGYVPFCTFLSGVLLDEGGYDFKRAVVEAMFDMIKFIGGCKEQALSYLCEFIEDCEFTKIVDAHSAPPRY